MILSIICPTFNEEKYIEQTINSFIQQQCNSFDLEILICDGMSTDNTRKIVQSFQEKYTNIRLVDNIKRKTPFAFNIGLKEAKGGYVAILGAHTKYENNYLQACFDALIETNSIGCSGRVITESAFNTMQAKLSEWVMQSSFGVSGNSFRVMKEGYVYSVNFPVFQKQALIELGGYDETFIRNQDNNMNQRLLDAGHQLYCTWKTKCFYRPPANINKLFNYAYTNGWWNANSFIVHRKSMRWHHFIPFVFAIAIIFSLVAGIIGYYVSSSFIYLGLFVLIVLLHAMVGVLATIQLLILKFDYRKIFLPFIFFGFHFSYGWGTIKGFIQKLIKK